MVFLPIVERELRVATRRKGTYRVRVWTTLLALVVSVFAMAEFEGGGGTGSGAGRGLFAVLTWYTFGVSLLSGVLLAADCLSEEKREGTLGLLFLTDLKGYDVVLGKLMAVGLSALYGLVAVLPVSALALLMGGLTGAEYWRTAASLVNALFFSQTLGVMVSAWSRESTRAMANTLGLLIVAVVGLPMVGWLAALGGVWSNVWYLSAASPYSSFSRAGNFGTNQFWVSLLISHLTGWFFLLLASWTLPRLWQDKPFRPRAKGGWRAFRWAGSSRTTNPALRARLIDRNPILWLAGSDRSMQWRAWVLAVICAGVTLLVAPLQRFNELGVFSGGATVVLWLFGGLFKMVVAVQATRFFVEARRSGALEMLVSTPLTAREIIQGQWLALKRLFVWPMVVMLAPQLVALACGWVNMAQENHMPLAGVVCMSLFGIPYRMGVFVLDFVAIGWLGMALGLTAKKPGLAAAFTILFGVLLPFVAVCVPDFIFDLILIAWARSKLDAHWIRVAKPQYQPLISPGLRNVYPPPVQSPPPPPFAPTP